MPLLISPIDGSPMRQIHRYGIEIDVCPTSGGIWLDRGELEKLMAIIKDDVVNESSAAYSPSRPDHRAPKYGRDDDDDDDRYEKNYRHHGKKSKLSRIVDIFDF